MDEWVSRLLEIVRDEVEVYQNLLEHERRKTLLLARGQVEKLLECNKSEEDELLRLRELDAERSRLCGDLGHELRIPREELTLARLAGHLAEQGESERDSQELRSAGALLGDVVRRLGDIGARNRRLIDRVQQRADGLLAIFAGAVGSYQPDGTFEAAAAVHPTFSQNA
jgi:hypothetical protein